MTTKKPTPKGNPGRMAGPRKEQARVRTKMLGKAKMLAEGLEASDNSSYRTKGKDGKWRGWQADTPYRATSAKEYRAMYDNQNKSKRATGKITAKKSK